MARFQKRRCVAMSNATYERLSAYCEANGIPKARLVEHLLQPVLANVRLAGEDQHEDLLDFQPAVAP